MRAEPGVEPVTVSSPGAGVRSDLISAAYVRVRADGVEALQARGIAKDVGVSTTAVYTHFGGMAGLIVAVAQRAFADFSAAIDAPAVTDDPLADLLACGIAYRNFAVREPFAYELLFNRHISVRGPGVRTEFATSSLAPDDQTGADAYEKMQHRVESVIAAGIVDAANPDLVTAQLWCAMHGFVCLDMVEHFGDAFPPPFFGSLAVSMLVGLGAERADVFAALGRALERLPLAESDPTGSAT